MEGVKEESKASVKSDRLNRLRDLHMKRNEARKLNHVEVQEEERRAKLPKNWESQKRRADWLLDEDDRKKEAAEAGTSWDRAKLLGVQADDVERTERLKAKKLNPHTGFSNYEDQTIRQHRRLTNALTPDMAEYEKEKSELGDAFYAGRDTVLIGLRKDSTKAIDRMVNDLEKQVEKREKFSRRRMHNDEADIDYINERNMRFNKKLERFYGEYTAEIKQNLERGTAI